MWSTIRNALTSVFFLCTTASSSLAIPLERQQDLYEYACAAIEVQCTLPKPRLFYGSLRWSGGMLGAYAPIRTPDVIWLDVNFLSSTASEPYRDSIYIHEVVHYIMFSNGMLEKPYDSCNDVEAPAWRVSNSWLTQNGHHSLARWNWRDSYPQCKRGV